ncbi:MAG TPA: hypothetical protein VI815_02665 [Candidatus Nanoarchaeia archaeon]|nr:hypothetical protein [Candidatus Nanoarchaeia archaeon]
MAEVKTESVATETAVVDPTQGELLCGKLDEITEQLKTDIIRFFDKGMKAPGKRVNTGSSAMTKFMKELRAALREKRETIASAPQA